MRRSSARNARFIGERAILCRATVQGRRQYNPHVIGARPRWHSGGLMGKRKMSRRQFLEGTGTVLTVAAAAPALRAQPRPPAAPHTTIALTLNGSPRTIDFDDRWTLAAALRDHLGLTGTKIGCDRGQCGACTVLMDGKPGYSCSQLAVWMDGRSIQTVDGLLQNRQLSTLQQSFIDHNPPQCGS